MHFLSSCGCFSTWFIATIKRNKIAVLNIVWQTSVRRHTNQIASLLSLTELMILAINISTSYMVKNIRNHNGCTCFIYFQTWIYTLSLRITVPRKVPIAQIWGFTPLNTSFMTQLGLKVVIIDYYYMKSKWKICQFICNAQKSTHILRLIHCVMSLARYSRKLTVKKKATLGVGLILSQPCCYGYHQYACNIYLKLVF